MISRRNISPRHFILSAPRRPRLRFQDVFDDAAEQSPRFDAL